MFNCQYCNKECKSKLSKSCHERLCKLNPNKVNDEYLRQNAINTNKKLKEKYQQIKNEKIIFECICENCGKKFYIEDSKNRKYFPKCCSSKCAHSLSGKTNNKGEKEVICETCGKSFKINKHSTNNNHTCNECKEKIKKEKLQNKLQNKIQKQINQKIIKSKNKKIITKRYISEETRLKLREAGKKSAKKQAELRRSKNEIEFCKLCEEYFDNVEHNKPIFNGWDADVIIHDIKYAILWNGKVHYEPIFGQANYNRVINRDKIKLKEIERAGYIPYIIKDIGKHKNDFVKEKFEELLNFIEKPDFY